MIDDTSSPYSSATLFSESHDVASPILAPRKLLAALIGGDLLFIVLHWLHVHTNLLTSERWSIARDRGYGEMFQYLKYAGIMFALSQLFRKTRLPVLLLWIGVYGFLLLDDSMRIHERIGLDLVAWAHIADFGGLRGRDWGELIYATIGGAFLTPVLVVAYIRSSSMARAISINMGILLAALLMFAIGGDAIHRLLSTTAFDAMATIVEDGGEMLALSLTCFYVARYADGASGASLGRSR
ncbi:hypothetical protein ACFPN2_26035 [Steroidobacter flavus]|uniref:Uncharacterized protein n=1 Tax=Steroidobacter flavus TaxID=1842136 RepID=A0ABV8T0H8_9GAMM